MKIKGRGKLAKKVSNLRVTLNLLFSGVLPTQVPKYLREMVKWTKFNTVYEISIV